MVDPFKGYWRTASGTLMTTRSIFRNRSGRAVGWKISADRRWSSALDVLLSRLQARGNKQKRACARRRGWIFPT
jgi:hypothetical protein